MCAHDVPPTLAAGDMTACELTHRNFVALNYSALATSGGLRSRCAGSKMAGIKILRSGVALVLVGVVLIAGGVAAAQAAENSDPPVIGGDSSTSTTTAPQDDADVIDDTVADDTVADDTVVTEVVAVEGDAEELAFTGSDTDALGYSGAALVLIGIYLTMFGQPSVPHGRHSAPSSRLRMSLAGLAISSITASLGSATKRRR